MLATTTPRRTELMRKILAEAEAGKVALATGRTLDNREVLPADYFAAMIEQFEATAFGRQELDGEMVDALEGALWNRTLLDRCRHEGAIPPARRVVVAVDPPAGRITGASAGNGRGDACGIVVAMLGADDATYVRADCTVESVTPETWARAVAQAARAWNADRVVAESNQGGAMVESVLRAADISLPLKLVHASRSKVARAEPVAALYEAGRVKHAGLFAALEDQLCGLMTGGGYEGPGRSPDRADALVWALSELMLAKKPEPRVSFWKILACFPERLGTRAYWLRLPHVIWREVQPGYL